MSTTPYDGPLEASFEDPYETGGTTAGRRVRHEARDAVAVMAFSAVASSVLALLLTLAVRMGG